MFVSQAQSAVKILNVRGGANTGGFLEGGSDEQLSSFLDHTTANGNHSWGEFADLLKANGFEITEVREGANKAGCDASKGQPCSDPVNFDSVGLAKYDVIIFGSNNSRYSPGAVGALLKYVDQGGGAVFISDGNFGRNWGDAPNSDQAFLDSVGWNMNQDGGTYTVSKADGKFTAPDHAILKGVNSFDGEGVSPITVTKANFNGFTSTVLALAQGDVHRNTSFGGGSNTAATPLDATLCVATRNKGRIVGHYDRNTFFDANGAGTNLGRFDNKTLGLNILRWASAGHSAVSVLSAGRNVRPNSAGAKERSIGGRVYFYSDFDGITAFDATKGINATASDRAYNLSGRVAGDSFQHNIFAR